jgi:hypothetical protein
MGVWTKIGTVLFPIAADNIAGLHGTSNCTVLYDTNPRVLSGTPSTKVFKMWFEGADNINYAESFDGRVWTRRAGTILAGGKFLPKIFKNNGIYYLYIGNAVAPTAIAVYTSADGINFALANATALIPNPAVGSWDGFSVSYLKPFFQDTNGVWYGCYSAAGGGGHSGGGGGIATSNDLLHWTNAPSPISGAGGGPDVTVIDGRFYMWTATVIGSPGGINTQLGIISSPDMINWSAPAAILPETQINEGFNNTAAEGNGVPCVVEANGNSYIYYSATNGNGVGYTVMGAIANQTLAQVVAGTQGIATQSFSSTQLAADTFQRANEVPLSNGGKWILPGVGYAQTNLTSNKAVGTSIGTNSKALWNAFLNADAYSQATIGTIGANSSVLVQAREDTSGNFYILNVTPTAWSLSVIYTASVVVALSSGNRAFAPGDTIGIAVAGSTIQAFHNGVLISTVADSTLTTGHVGFGQFDSVSVNNVSVSSWSGGSYSGASSVVDSRQYGIFPNLGHNLQNTIIYDAQAIDSRVTGSVDSRIAPNVPIDSRVSTIVPINSRT